MTTFSALRVRDFRLYFVGQLCSISGANAQTVAAGWLILQLTNSGTVLGLVTAAQFLPMLLLAPALGPVVDRLAKRRILVWTQVGGASIAFVLWLLAATHHAAAWNIAVLMFLLGAVNALDNPTRQAFIREVVGDEILPNALALNNVLMSSARIAGPAIAGIIIAVAGIANCFLFNALTFTVIIAALAAMTTDGRVEVHASIASFRSGLRYVSESPSVRHALLLMAFVGTFTYEFWVTLPVLVKTEFAETSTVYASLMTVLSIGSIAGGLLIARHSAKASSLVMPATIAFGATTCLVGLSPNLLTAFVASFLMGGAYSAFGVTLASSLQHGMDSRYRGRVMALWSSAYMGSTAIGGPIMGFIAQHFGVRTSLVLGGAIAIVAVLILKGPRGGLHRADGRADSRSVQTV